MEKTTSFNRSSSIKSHLVVPTIQSISTKILWLGVLSEYYNASTMDAIRSFTKDTISSIIWGSTLMRSRLLVRLQVAEEGLLKTQISSSIKKHIWRREKEKDNIGWLLCSTSKQRFKRGMEWIGTMKIPRIIKATTQLMKRTIQKKTSIRKIKV